MSQRTIFIYGLIVLAVFLFAVRMWLVNSVDEPENLAASVQQDGLERLMHIRADRREWISVGRGPLMIRAEGSIDIGGRTAMPDDDKLAGDSAALAPELPYGALVGKVGSTGRPFKVGRLSQVAMKEEIFLAINDADYSDNIGSYTVRLSSDLY
jgi:hypothetical protein